MSKCRLFPVIIPIAEEGGGVGDQKEVGTLAFAQILKTQITEENIQREQT